MALLKSLQVLAMLPLLNADGAASVVPVFGDFVVPAGLAVSDVVEMVGVPAGYVPIDVIADHDDLGATFTADFGWLTGKYGSNDAARTCGAQFIAGADLAAAPGVKRSSVAGATRQAPLKGSSNMDEASGDRGIGFVVKTLAGVAAGTKIRLTVLFRPQIEGR